MECYHAIRKYGPMRMALNLKNKRAISLLNYIELSNLDAHDNQKALVIVNILIHSSTTISQFQKIIQFFGSERSLWHLSHLLTQIG